MIMLWEFVPRKRKNIASSIMFLVVIFDFYMLNANNLLHDDKLMSSC